MTTERATARLRGLVIAAHAPPSLAVTFMAALLAVGAELGGRRLALVTAAVGSGQLSIGWLNDWWDAEKDRAAGRADKPIVAGAVSRSLVGVAAALAAVICAATSVALGAAGAVNFSTVGAGWTYDVWAKGTRASVVPYIAAFGLFPAVATLASTPPRWPTGWVMMAGALLGAGGHFANALPDLAGDARVGVRGLPQRLGSRSSLVAAAGCLGAGALVACAGVLASGGTRSGPAAATAGLIVTVTLVGVIVAARHNRLRLAFRLTIGLAVVVVGMLVVAV